MNEARNPFSRDSQPRAAEHTPHPGEAGIPGTPVFEDEPPSRSGSAERVTGTAGSTHSAGTVTDSGQAIDEGRGRIFPCDSCGADLVFHIGLQNLKCEYCGFVKTIDLQAADGIREQDFAAVLRQQAERRKQPARPDRASAPSTGDQQAPGQVEVNEIRCDSCGGTVEFLGSLTSSACPWCDSPVQRENVHRAGDRIPVDAVLPFQIPRRKAEEQVARWVASRWFAPNDFRQQGANGKLNGIYMPYWTYDAFTTNEWAGQRGDRYTDTVRRNGKTEHVRKTRWSSVSGAFQRFFDDVLVLASGRLHRDLTDALEPWPLNQCRPFSPEMLAGYFARTYEIELDAGFEMARRRIEEALRADVCRRIGGDSQRISRLDTAYEAITFKHLLLPVWLMANRHHGRVYQVIVNAGTGEVQGERPWSFWKLFFLLAGIGLLVAVAGLLTHA
ncbi:MAG: hypothetical protein KDA79_08430 [Planctomycetaceae bacterium]|nr:hypothetical protein [Planctomycetaceae bacterium]